MRFDAFRKWGWRRRAAITAGVICVLIALNFYAESSFAFGIRERDYPQYFGGDLNHVLKFNDDPQRTTRKPISAPSFCT